MLGVLAQSTANAQVFSPGELAQDHAELDSLQRCDACHTSRKKSVDRKKCLQCHTVVQTRARARKGFHGQASVRGKGCETCHSEHKGRDAVLVNWPAGMQKRFNHNQTGWTLKDAHLDVKCVKCHETRRQVAKDVRAYLKKNPGTQTFLGLDKTCTTCHFDEHRDSLKQDCLKCHDQKKWKSQPRFKHDEAWKLEGAHAEVKCDKCHESLKDPNYNPRAFPKPRAADYLKASPLEHEDCLDCHKDPHRKRFGDDCLDCHTMKDWSVAPRASQKRKLEIHRKTAFPLVGRHQKVPCGHCHVRLRNGKRKLVGIPHKRCDQCHPTAHPELEEAAERAGADAVDGADGVGRKVPGCDDCHTEEGYQPSTYTLKRHEKARYQLEDAHVSVACVDCHQQQLGGPREVGDAKRVRGYLAAQVLSPWLLAASDLDLKQCTTCHDSPHREQFEDKACVDCHSRDTWHMADDFDHGEKTDYPLEGKHTEVACDSCHEKETDEAGEFVRYADLEFESCSACHGDQHYGQFRKLEPVLDCQKCHQTKAFDALLFKHNDPAYSNWPLKGKHEDAKCEGCHLTTTLAPGAEVVRYRPTPTECALCHEDNHDGAYREASRLVKKPWEQTDSTGATPGDTRPAQPMSQTGVQANSTPVGWTLPQTHLTSSLDKSTDCTVCHQVSSWRDMRFNHSSTGFPLKGRHKQVRCEGCHDEGHETDLSTDCASCHDNIHGVLGTECAQCHNEEGFQRPVMQVSRHARTSFPLLGKHAVASCRDCHTDVAGLSFMQAPSDCFACHQAEVPLAGANVVDHSTFPSTCGTCHMPSNWQAANFRQHDRCFPIRLGSNHFGYSCSRCHTQGLPAVTGTCADSGVSCISCHSCESGEHGGVAGYECADRKCYQCHPGGRG